MLLEKGETSCPHQKFNPNFLVMQLVAWLQNQLSSFFSVLMEAKKMLTEVVNVNGDWRLKKQYEDILNADY
jgi:hypothetical protein